MACSSKFFTNPARLPMSKIYQDLGSSLLSSTGDRHMHTSVRMESDGHRRKPAPGIKPHVGIVGAGLAGLRCADILLQRGFRVTVMEGRDRVGGRIYQERLPNGHWVDMGANWVHGTKNNPFMDLMKQTGTSVGDFESGAYCFDEDGRPLTSEAAEKYSQIVWDIVAEAFEHSNTPGVSISEDESLHDFFKKRLEKIIPDSQPGWKEGRKLVMQMCELWGAWVGSPIERQSLKFFWLEECIEGENLFVAGTYKKVLELIARPALADAEIVYNTVVQRIIYRSSLDDKVIARLANGQSLSFDELVTTTPLGWLKRNPGAFEPPLPPRLTKAITSIGYGCLEKVYISFPTAFWLSGKDKGDYVEGFVQYLSPGYAAESNPERWHIDFVDMGNLSDGDAHPTLLFYTYGRQSAYLTDKVSGMADAKEKDKFLKGYFKPYYSRLPSYVEGSPDCTPSAFKATDWLHDELAGNGSYCNFQVGLTEGDEDIRTMRRGVPEGGLWFAGEHTAPFVALGTATGAYWSGEMVGKRLASVYGLETEGS